MSQGRFRQIRWHWVSADSDLRNAYLTLDGRVSLSDLNTYMRAVASNVPADQIMVNFGTVTWRRPADAEELAERERWRADAQAKREQWELKMYAELHAKYGPAGSHADLVHEAQP